MDPRNAERILGGEQFVGADPRGPAPSEWPRSGSRASSRARTAAATSSSIDDTKDVIKLAGRAGPFDLAAEYGVSEKLVEALDTTTQLAMAAGIDALREAGIPLVQTYRKTTTGKYLPERWLLPEPLRDETGVIFASAFPGLRPLRGRDPAVLHLREPGHPEAADPRGAAAGDEDPGARRRSSGGSPRSTS